jgi:hypothetical protein
LKIFGRVGIFRFFHVVSQGPRKFATQPATQSSGAPVSQLRTVSSTVARSDMPGKKISFYGSEYSLRRVRAERLREDSLHCHTVDRRESFGKFRSKRQAKDSRYVALAPLLHYNIADFERSSIKH